MLTNINAVPSKPERVVIIGAGGFVGSAIRKKLAADSVATLPLTRVELDLLAADAARKLAQILRPATVW